MGTILNIIEEHSGGKCFASERYLLDSIVPLDYQDKGESLVGHRVFETENRAGKNIKLSPEKSTASIFRFFLDGARRTYKIVDFASTDNKFLPIIGGQIGAAVCVRENRKLKKYKLVRANVLALPDRLGGEFQKIKEEITKFKKHGLGIDNLLKYTYQENPSESFENLAIAKIQVEMLNIEIELVKEIVDSNKLSSSKMLIIDGSLQFGCIGRHDHIFENVIGISKKFNPHLQGILKTKRKEIGFHLVNMKFGERTAVYMYRANGEKQEKNKIGAWYLRIHPRRYVRNPLDGIVKVEKIAVTKREKEYGFPTEQVDEISRAILAERNVCCHGNDERWASHLYPIYLTEKMIKSSFASEIYFLNIF